MGTDGEQGHYILSLSLHGLVRSFQIELGRDADTGGQVTYVIEQIRALARHPEVGRVELMTRQIFGRNVDSSYAEPFEEICPGARIVRLACGPRRYLRKESLWPYLDEFVDRALLHIRKLGRNPDIIHGHYADAGYVGAQLAQLLGVPFVFTGHSLGRVKRRRLLEKGGKEEALEDTYHFGTRIEAEETALVTASLVVTSTHQEVEEQYALYEHYVPYRMEVIPPGVDLSRFRPPVVDEPIPPIAQAIGRFLDDANKPMILAMARPDERKNLAALVHAYAKHEGLRERANLVIIAGTRDDIADLDAGSRRVLTELLVLIDRYDLYGKVAYPKKHTPEDVPALYRLAARSKGVFVNPALTEPFGLTLIEAAASGLPIVATHDGGPRDIVAACHNGELIDPLKPDQIAEAIHRLLADSAGWHEMSKLGVRGAHDTFSWGSHVERYVGELRNLLIGRRRGSERTNQSPRRLPRVDRILFTDVDNTLTGDDEALHALLEVLDAASDHAGFAIVTGRRPDDALESLRELGAPAPDILICCVGTEIHYGEGLTVDQSWLRHIDNQWLPNLIQQALSELPGLKRQEEKEQRRFKISYYIDPEKAPSFEEIRRLLRQRGLRVRLLYSHGMFLDVVPLRASPGLAIRFLAQKWDLAPHRMLVAGDSGTDEDMLRGNTLGVVVGNYSPELELLRGEPRIYFAKGQHAWGILEGIEHYDFLGDIKVPEPQEAAADEDSRVVQEST